jgi:short-subunit dehydrogenase
VRAIAVCPGTTTTNFFQTAGAASDPTDSALTMTPDAVAAAALAALASSSSQVVPGFGNKVYTFLSSKISKPLAARIAGKIFARRWRGQGAT